MKASESRVTNYYSPTSWSVQMLASFRASIDDNHYLILFDGMSAYKRYCSSLSVFLFPSLSLIKLSLYFPSNLYLSFFPCLYCSVSLIRVDSALHSLCISLSLSLYVLSPPSLFLCISLILSLSPGCFSNNYL